MEQESPENPSEYGPMLAVIRRRRWYLWGLIIIYMPIAVATLQFTQSIRTIGAAFGAWVILLCVAVALMAAALCPRCGKNFHMRHSTLGFSRKCRHCGLSLLADRNGAVPQEYPPHSK